MHHAIATAWAQPSTAVVAARGLLCERSAMLTLRLLCFFLVAYASGCSEKVKQQEKPPSSQEAKKAPIAPPVAKKAPPVEELPSLPQDKGSHKGRLLASAQFGGPGMEAVRALASAPSQGVFAVGYSKPAATESANDSEILLARISSSGKVLWSREVGGPGPDVGLAADSDAKGNLFIAGSFADELSIGAKSTASEGADDIFVAKFSPGGKMQWTARFGGRDVDAAEAVAVGPEGRVYVTGAFRAKAKFGSKEITSKGDADIFLLVLEPDGTVHSVNQYGSLGVDIGRAIHIGSTGDITLATEFSSTLEVSGKTLKSKGQRDTLILRLAKNGAIRWLSHFGNSLDDWTFDMDVDPSGSVVFVGGLESELEIGKTKLTSAGRADAYVAKLSADGTPLWAHRFGGESDDFATSAAIDKFGNTYVSGGFFSKAKINSTTLTSEGDRDVFASKWSPTGRLLWVKQFGGIQTDSARGIALTNNGGAFGGAFHLETKLEGKTLFTAKSKPDALIPKADAFVLFLSR